MKRIFMRTRQTRTAQQEFNEAAALLCEFGIELQPGSRSFVNYSVIFVEDSQAQPALAHLLASFRCKNHPELIKDLN